MFEYIKRVSVAINFVAQKIDLDGAKIKSLLEDLGLEFLYLAQSFRTDKYKLQDLQKLQIKVSYLIDLVDFARINGFISQMNAKVFIDSQVAFLKHILNLIEQKNSLYLPVYRLKELDDFLARKSAKESLQNKFANNLDFSFGENIFQSQKNIFNYADLATKDKQEEKVIVKEKENTVEKNDYESEDIQVYKDTRNIKNLEENNSENISKVFEAKNLSTEREIELRREKILHILSSGGCSIREIADKMEGINEKTIQRDLIELMQDKKVIMLGKKRWARYYLK